MSALFRLSDASGPATKVRFPPEITAACMATAPLLYVSPRQLRYPQIRACVPLAPNRAPVQVARVG